MNFLLDPEQALRCQRFEQLQRQAELSRRHRQSQDSRSHLPARRLSFRHR